MLFQRTGNTLERNNKAGRFLTVLIILLCLALGGSLLLLYSRYQKGVNKVPDIYSPERLEQRVQGYNGLAAGLEVWGNPYPFGDDSYYRKRWAVSEWFGERVLEDAYRNNGDNASADAAHARAERFASQAGTLSEEIVEADHDFISWKGGGQ